MPGGWRSGGQVGDGSGGRVGNAVAVGVLVAAARLFAVATGEGAGIGWLAGAQATINAAVAKQLSAASNKRVEMFIR